MNIWAWFHQARSRLAAGDARAQRLLELVDALPTAAVNEAHERVDAMVPEALALVRELDEPWLEVFVRHWNLQSRVLHRRRAGDELREAVALLDFANGPRTSGCPQSVCAVQDVAVCYAVRDGPGYVPERLAVARETLARIDSSWACFDCINGEYVSALLDDGQAEQALAFIDAQQRSAAEQGQFEVGFNARFNRARALRELGRAGESLALLEGLRRPERYGSSRLMAYRQSRVASLLALGRCDEALALHPPLSKVIDTGAHLREWVDNLVALIEAERVPNRASVGCELLRVFHRFEGSDAYWDSARTALIGARLALARGARQVARLFIDEAGPFLAKLRRGATLVELRAQLLAQLEQPRATPTPTSPALDPALQLDSTCAAELELERMHGEAADADSADAVLARAKLLRELGWARRARDMLEHAAASLEGEQRERASLELAAAMLGAGDHDALDALVAQRQAGASSSSLGLRWILGQSLLLRRQLDEAMALDQHSLAQDPPPPLALRLQLRLAATARKLERWDVALAALERAALVLPPGDLDWDRMTAATVLQRWDRVRAAAARLELPLPGADDEPIDIDMGVVRCEFVDASGARERYWALRTSPCAARIIEISMPADPQHFRDRVVFEPVDLDAHLREEGQPHTPCYEVLTQLEPGRQRGFLLRGHDPGEAGVEGLRARVRERGWGFERVTARERSAADPRPEAEGEQRPTMGVLIAMAQREDPRALRDLIAECCAQWPLPLLCPSLERAVGEEEAAKAAEALLARWRP